MRDQLRQTAPPSTAAGESNDLARLLETEAQLEEMLRRTREEATRLVAAAGEAAVAREAALTAQVGADARGLEETLQADYERRVTDASAAADRDVARLDRVEDDQVAVLARYMVSRVIGTAP
jgi:hypothetical protein